MTDLVMPAEWEPHERCLLAWVGADLASTRLITAAKRDYALVARRGGGAHCITLAQPALSSGRAEGAP